VIVAGEGSGITAARMCPHTNFAASADHGHGLPKEMAGSAVLLSMPEAIEMGREIFANLLDD
jgi:hypothetical protein